MKIKNNVPQLLTQKQGVMNVQVFAREVGLSYPTAHSWANGKINRVDFETLSKLCIYFNCSVGDILSRA